MPRRRRRKRGKRGLAAALDRSPINYFSDLFVVTMVLGWITVLLVMVVVATYATIRFCDTSMWGDVANLVAVPLSCGGAIWMVKNSVQHALAYKQGRRAHMDFPAVNADGQEDGNEQLMNTDGGAKG